MAALLVAGVLAVAAAGCTDDPPVAPTSPPTTASPPATVDAARAAAEEEVLRIYRAHLAASAAAYGAGRDPTAEMKKYLADPLLTQTLTAQLSDLRKGHAYIGELKSDPRIGQVNLAAKPPTITIEDCLDATNYKLVNRSNNSPIAVPPVGRYFTVTTATRYPQRGWLLNKAVRIGDRKC